MLWRFKTAKSRKRDNEEMEMCYGDFPTCRKATMPQARGKLEILLLTNAFITKRCKLIYILLWIYMC